MLMRCVILLLCLTGCADANIEHSRTPSESGSPSSPASAFLVKSFEIVGSLDCLWSPRMSPRRLDVYLWELWNPDSGNRRYRIELIETRGGGSVGISSIVEYTELEAVLAGLDSVMASDRLVRGLKGGWSAQYTTANGLTIRRKSSTAEIALLTTETSASLPPDCVARLRDLLILARDRVKQVRS